MGYLHANFSLPRPLCSRLTPDVRDRQIDRRQTSDVRRASSLNAPYPRGGSIIDIKLHSIYVTIIIIIITLLLLLLY